MSRIRPVNAADAPAIADIYNYYVRNTAITFDENIWSSEDALAKIEKLASGNYPFWVCCEGDEILGYSYASQWNAHSAFITTAETTVYLAPAHIGKGLGTQLMRQLIEHLDCRQFHCLVACICTPNDISVTLHEKLGFKQVSHFKDIGYKLNEWRDVGHWTYYL